MKLQDIFVDALPILQKFAPSFGRIVLGPYGNLALSLLSRAFNLTDSDPRSLVTQILNDKDAPEKLQKLEHQHGDWICDLLDSMNNLSRISLLIEWK